MASTTSKESLKAAWGALLRGDMAERDREVERGRMLLEEEHKADAIQKLLAVDFYVTKSGSVIPTATIAKAANVIN